jgi:hypothetical protein
MKKIVVINSCNDCVRLSHKIYGYCYELERHIQDLVIPDDCPLPNAEDEDEKNGKV